MLVLGGTVIRRSTPETSVTPRLSEPPIKVLQTFAFPVPRHYLIRTEKSAIPFRDCTLSWARSFRMCDEAL